MATTEPTDVIAPPALLRRASWGAIFAGSIVALAIIALFGLLGLALGFSAVDPTDPRPFSGIGTGTIVWWIITSVVALLVGGFVAGRLAGVPRGVTALLHGLAVWALVSLLTLWLATTAVGKVVSLATSVVVTTAETAVDVVGAAGSAAASGAGAVAREAELGETLREETPSEAQVRQEASEILGAAGIGQQDAAAAQQEVQRAAGNVVRRPGTLDEEVSRLIDRLFAGPDAVITPAERQRLVEEIAQRAGVTPEEAERIAGRWEAQAQAAGQQVTTTAQSAREGAGEVAQDVLDGLSKAAWGAFIASIIGLLAALGGSALGIPPAFALPHGDRHADARHRETA